MPEIRYRKRLGALKKAAPYPKTCATCGYCSLVNPGDEAGYCRRYPPVVTVVADVIDRAWPVVNLTEVCGEYARLTH